jgi:lipocalin-like protein
MGCEPGIRLKRAKRLKITTRDQPPDWRLGTFSVDLQEGAVIHDVKGAWLPNVEGSEQVRRFCFVDNKLVLVDADTDWGKVGIVCTKAAPMKA